MRRHVPDPPFRGSLPGFPFFRTAALGALLLVVLLYSVPWWREFDGIALPLMAAEPPDTNWG